MATAEIDAPVNALDAFRAQAREWLAENFDPGLRGKDNSMSAVEGPNDDTSEQLAWKKAIGEKGWSVPTWPTDYGGGGLSRGTRWVAPWA